MSPILMPDPQDAREAGITADYSEYRIWWAESVLGLKVRRRSRTIRPEPGVLDVAEEELG